MPLFSRLIASSLVVTVLVACAPPTAPATPDGSGQPTGEQREARQVLRIGTQGLAQDLLPRDGAIAQYQYWFLYDNLTQLTKDYQVAPSAAERWELSPDGLVWTFTLRRDIRWPDGAPLTANDVAFTMNTLIERNWPVRSRFATTTQARVASEFQVEFVTRQPDQSVPNNGGFLWILPQRAVQAAGGLDAFLQRPVGSSPWELIEFRVADVIRLQRKATSHAFRQVFADEVIIRSIPEPSQLIAGLRTGELDIAAQVNFTIEQVEQLRQAGMTIIAPPAINQYVLIMTGPAGARNTPLQDRRVRQAMNYAIDREAIARTFFRGFAQPMGQLAVPGSLYFDPDARPWPYDPQRARRLLAEAGYPNGFRLPQGLDFTPSRSSPDVMIAVRGYLQEVGIEFDVNQLEVGTWTDRAFGRNNAPQPDLLGTFSAESDGFFTNFRIVIGCDRPAGAGPTRAWYCNPEWDRLYDAALPERDPQRRAQFFRQANRVFQEDAAAIFLVVTPQFTIASAKTRDVEIVSPVLYNFDRVYRVR